MKPNQKQMKIKFLYLILILFFLPELITAQKVRSLNECISTGLENNFSMLIIKNSETIAKNNFSLGNAGFLPTLDLSGRQNGSLNNNTRKFRRRHTNLLKRTIQQYHNMQVCIGLNNLSMVLMFRPHTRN